MIMTAGIPTTRTGIPTGDVRREKGGDSMATIGKCLYCGAAVASDQRKCPFCGGANPGYVDHSVHLPDAPRTIEELKAYCAEHGTPLPRMRFFIGEDYREPKAFGIYRDGSSFVVYKNKADGTRFVRYQGADEASAVRELFAKLLDECHIRGIYPENQQPSGKK